MSMLDLIHAKKYGHALSREGLRNWIYDLTREKVADYQTAALLAFIFCRGMNHREVKDLTELMRDSGKPFRYKNFPKGAWFCDKHSTGGVGDKITLPLMPLVTAAADNIYVPTIAGRGLGHTGGTVDKLESIPGLKTGLSMSRFYAILRKYRLSFLSQTKEIAPADRVLYALRDVTGTVESIPLITASILSKKLSESLHSLLLDVKFGSGAFMQKMEDAEALAISLVEVAAQTGIKVDAYLTSMESPLGLYSGNALEVDETLQILKGEGPEDTTQLTKEFAQRMLEHAGFTRNDSKRRIENSLQSGAAFDQFLKVVEAQGGSLSRFEKSRRRSKVKIKSLIANRSGILSIDVREFGFCLVDLGGGRKRKGDKIDMEVGFYHPVPHGSEVERGQEILRIYFRESKALRHCENRLQKALQIVDERFSKSPLIRKILSK